MTTEEIQMIVAMMDVAVKAAGINIFQDNGGVKVQNILEKLQAQLDENEKKDAQNDT